MANVRQQILNQAGGASSGGGTVGLLKTDLAPRNPLFENLTAALPQFNRQANQQVGDLMARAVQARKRAMQIRI